MFTKNFEMVIVVYFSDGHITHMMLTVIDDLLVFSRRIVPTRWQLVLQMSILDWLLVAVAET